jgi:hypothetical protein
VANRTYSIFVLLVFVALAGCEDSADSTPDTITIPDDTETDGDGSGGDWQLKVTSAADDGYVADDVVDCLLASPLMYDSEARGKELIISGGDVIMGADPDTGERRWLVELPEPEGLRALVVATPSIRGEHLFVGYNLRDAGTTDNALEDDRTYVDDFSSREAHYVAVVDLEAKAIDEDFAPTALEASVPGNDDAPVEFLSSNAFLRSDTGWWGQTDESLGYGYVSFGNVRDIQPWHGWMFEIDFDAWAAGGDAIGDVLVTTPETECGEPGSSGSYERICGGGLWSPTGSLRIDDTNGTGLDYEVIAAPGNGQLDLERDDYANTLMRLEQGLDFDPECDVELCEDFDSASPSRECVESCKNLFIPRLNEGEGPVRPEDGTCDGQEFFECWANRDYIGGSTPIETVAPGGERVLVYPTKDGHVYLVDSVHMGTQYDREQLVEYCGTEDDQCRWKWAGMIVTQPTLAHPTEDRELILVPTFMPDHTHPAGLVAVSLVDTEDGPKFQREWEYPDFSSSASRSAFRVHPTLVTTTEFNGVEVAIIVERSEDQQTGTVRFIRTTDGALMNSYELPFPAYRFTKPLVDGDHVYFSACGASDGRGQVLALEMEAEYVND